MLLIGTLLYAAPEQRFDASRVDHRADIYSLGMTAVFVLHGKRLPAEVFENEGRQAFIAKLDCPKALRDVLRKAVDADRSKRYQLMDELRADLEHTSARLSFGRIIGAQQMTSLVCGPMIEGNMSAWRNHRARAAMKDRLRTNSEFEAFLIDHFDEVQHVIPSNRADRLDRENALIQKVGAEAILQALDGPRYALDGPRYALYWLRLAAAAIGLVAVGGLAMSRFPSPNPQPNLDMTVLANVDLSIPHPPPLMSAPPPAKRVKSQSVPKLLSLSGNAECNGPICRLLGISAQTLKRAQETQLRAICLDSKDVGSARMGIQAKCTVVSEDEPPECRRLDAMSNIPLVSARWRLCEAE